MIAARIENGVVADLWEVPSLDCYGDLYDLVAATGHCVIGSSYDGAVFTQPVQAAEEIVSARKAEILMLLASIDAKSIRPIREGDAARVAALEAQSAQLRAELAAL